MGVVPVPEVLVRLSQDPAFWSSLLDPMPFDRSDPVDPTASDPPPSAQPGGELRVSLPVAGGYGLVLDLDLSTGEQILGLREPATSEPVPLGRAAPGRPHEAALTFAELDLCARVIALDDPYLPHPGLVVALLSRFAPPDDDPVAVAVLRAAYLSLRRNAPPAIDHPGPEQAPLPLFADERWWPRPPLHHPQVLDADDVEALLLAPPGFAAQVRGTARFPRTGLAELMVQADARLGRFSHQPWYAAPRVLPLAQSIAATGDLRTVCDLLAALTEAGCDHPTVLDALSEPVVPAEACWMVETLTAVPRSSVLRRHLMVVAN